MFNTAMQLDTVGISGRVSAHHRHQLMEQLLPQQNTVIRHFLLLTKRNHSLHPSSALAGFFFSKIQTA